LGVTKCGKLDPLRCSDIVVQGQQAQPSGRACEAKFGPELALRPGDCGNRRLRRPLRFRLVAADGRLRGGRAGDGNAERRAGHVVHAHAVAELHRARLAADADFQVRIRLAAALDGNLHQLADAATS
jgi:hypothetical protein